MSQSLKKRKSPTVVRIQKFLGSLQLAIPLLFIIGVLSIMGGVVPQGTVEQVQQDAKMPEYIKPLVIMLQLHDVYRSPLFLMPMFLFFINLSFCTADQVLPRLFAAIAPKRAQLKAKVLKNMKPKVPLPDTVGDTALQAALKKHGYRRVYQDEERTFFEKNKFGRFAAIVTHIGLFSIIIGVVVGSLTGFKGQLTLVPGQTKGIQEIVANSENKGKYPPSFKNWQVSLSDFHLDLHDNGEIAQYNSMLRVLDEKGAERHSEMIWVNKPLIYEGVYFYQASWGVAGLKVVVGNKAEVLPVRQIPQMNANVTRFQDIKGKRFTFFLDPQNNIFIFNEQFQPVTSIKEGQTQLINGVPVTLQKLVLFTGLQVKLDYGIPLVYTSFWIVIAGVLLAFFAHREVWLVTIDEQRYLIGRTNKMKLSFFEELKRVFLSLNLSPDMQGEAPQTKTEKGEIGELSAT